MLKTILHYTDRVHMSKANRLHQPLHGEPLSLTFLREPIVSKALERKLREWTIVNTLEALDSKFILTKALTKL